MNRSNRHFGSGGSDPETQPKRAAREQRRASLSNQEAWATHLHGTLALGHLRRLARRARLLFKPSSTSYGHSDRARDGAQPASYAPPAAARAVSVALLEAFNAMSTLQLLTPVGPRFFQPRGYFDMQVEHVNAAAG